MRLFFAEVFLLIILSIIIYPCLSLAEYGVVSYFDLSDAISIDSYYQYYIFIMYIYMNIFLFFGSVGNLLVQPRKQSKIPFYGNWKVYRLSEAAKRIPQSSIVRFYGIYHSRLKSKVKIRFP